MNIAQILAQVDEIKPNTYDDNIKIAWLSELDGQIYNDVFLTHELDENVPSMFLGYTEADLNTELLFAQIDASNGETDRYANSMTLFNASFKDFKSDYNRQHMPLQKTMKF
jgi:hypothetical protein